MIGAQFMGCGVWVTGTNRYLTRAGVQVGNYSGAGVSLGSNSTYIGQDPSGEYMEGTIAIAGLTTGAYSVATDLALYNLYKKTLGIALQLP